MEKLDREKLDRENFDREKLDREEKGVPFSLLKFTKNSQKPIDNSQKTM